MAENNFWQDACADVPVDAYVIDTEVLIHEVNARDVLWNMSNEDFKDRSKKEEAWQEVFNVVNDGFGGLSESNKKLFGKYIQRKWKNIKDTYRKYKHSIQVKPGRAVKRKKKYVYEQQLRFLDGQLITLSKHQNNAEIELTDAEDVSQTGETDAGICKAAQSKRPKRVSVEERLVQYLEDKGSKRTEPALDEHQFFFNSLLSIVRRFDDDEVLEFRAAVVHIAQDIRRRKRR